MRNRNAFTLVEMLVVITIIGILSALVLTVAGPAMRRVKRLAVITEISQLVIALEKRHLNDGDHPPDFCGVIHSNPKVRTASRVRIIRYLHKRWPRYRVANWDSFRKEPHARRR